MRSDGPIIQPQPTERLLDGSRVRVRAHATGGFCRQQPEPIVRRYRVIVYCALTFFIFLDRRASRARLVLAKERILECVVSLMSYVQNLSEFGFVVQILQQWVFVNIGIAEETVFNAHSQHM
jgi:hypothetical protein